MSENTADQSTEQGPAKKHGDPLLNETESGDESPVQVPDVAKGTATSAEA